jgi:hypothetical protein
MRMAPAEIAIHLGPFIPIPESPPPTLDLRPTNLTAAERLASVRKYFRRMQERQSMNAPDTE